MRGRRTKSRKNHADKIVTAGYQIKILTPPGAALSFQTMTKPDREPVQPVAPPQAAPQVVPATPALKVAFDKEIGGQAGPEPTRYGDWERNGRVSDF